MESKSLQNCSSQNLRGHGSKGNQSTSSHLLRALLDWKWELLAVTLSSLLLLAAVGLLIKSDGTEQSSTGIFNLNSEIALISTFFRAALVYVQAQVISQLKWSWMEKPRPLRDLERFHTAANSAWAFLFMVFVVRRIHIVLFCTFSLLLSYGIGPFTQQAIQSVPCTRVESSQAAIPISHYVDLWMDGDALSLGNRGDIIHSISSSGVSDVSVTCPTGNCNFTAINNITHSSAGICSKCFDVSGLISTNITLSNGTVPANLTRLIWPDGPEVGDFQVSSGLVYLPAILNISATLLGFSEYAAGPLEPMVESTDELYHLANISYTLLSILAMKGFLDYTDPVGAACFLYPCIQSYHGLVENGIYTEEPVSAEPMHVYPEAEDRSIAAYGLQDPCVANGKTYTAANMSLFSSANPQDVFVLPGNATFTATGPLVAGEPGTTSLGNASTTVPRQCVYLIGGQFGEELSDFLQATFQGACTLNSCTDSPLDLDAIVCNPGFSTAYWLEALQAPSGGNMTFDAVAETMNNVAKAATNVIRVQGKSSAAINADAFIGKLSLTANQFSNETVLGDAIRSTICYDIRLAWLSYPLVFLVFTSSIVATIVIMSYNLRKAGKPVWKASILPLLFNGILFRDAVADDENHINGQDRSIKSMESRAEKMVVTLEERGGTYGFFVTQNSSYRALR